jgi:signal peptidase II
MILNKKKTVILIISAVFFVALDHFLKAAAVGGFFDQPVGILGDWFSLSFSTNKYIAFSLPLSGVILEIFIVALIAFLLFCFFAFLKKRQYDIVVPLTFIILGAISNMLDRLKFGYVVDYFNLKWFTIFNIADIMIVTGAIFGALAWWKEEKWRKLNRS